MIDLKGYRGFCLERGDCSPEANNIKIICMVKDIPIISTNSKDKCPIDYVPSGSVEFCLRFLGRNITPEYYPDWCKHLLYRNVWKGNKWLKKRVFVKPADKFKRFNGFLSNGDIKVKRNHPTIFLM